MTGSKRALSYLLRGAFLACCNLVTGILFGLVLKPYLVGTLGEREYGIYLFAGLFTGWCGLIDFGLTTAVSRFITLDYTEGNESRLNVTGNTALVLFAILGTFVLAVSGLTVGVIRLFWPTVPDLDLICLVLLVAGGGFGVSKLTDGVSGIINGTMRQELTGSRNLVFRILFGLATLSVLALGGRIPELLAVNFTLTVLQFLVLARLVRKACPTFRFAPRTLFRKSRVRDLFGYSIYTFLTQIGEMLIQRSDLLLIVAFLSIEDMTRYDLVVVGLVSYYGSFMNAMSNWMTNWFTHLIADSSNADAADQWRRLLYKAATYVTFFMSFGLIFWGRPFLTRWIGERYLDIFPCLLLCASVMAICRGHSEINLRFLQGIARHKYYAGLLLVQGILTIISGIVLLRLGFGLWGVAIGYALPMLFLHEFVLPVIICRLRTESLTQYELHLFTARGIAALALLPSVIIGYYLLAPDWSRLFLTGLLSLTFYALPVWFCGFSKKERAVLTGKEKIF